MNNNVLSLQKLIKDYQTLSLIELDKVQLLNRQDTKFVFNQGYLPLILKRIKPFYNILDIRNERVFTYKTSYFDTDKFLFYNQHHNEFRNRFKVRYRKYSSNSNSFFEIKIKNNKNRTVKKRLMVEDIKESLGDQEKEMVNDVIGLSTCHLSNKLNIKFLRITLTDKQLNERLTIDTNLTAQNGTISKIFDNLIISEIKQKKYYPKSPYIQILRELKIPEMRFSKYCMGMLHVNKGIKYNRFKPKLSHINKILTQA